MLELILDECKQDLDPDPVFKILFFRTRIRPKMYRIRSPGKKVPYLQKIGPVGTGTHNKGLQKSTGPILPAEI